MESRRQSESHQGFKIRMVVGLQNNIYEESHNGSADEPRYRNSDEPRDKDIPEQTPVN